MTTLRLALLLLLLLAAPAQAEDNVGANAVYDRMSAAYAKQDKSLLVDIFHPQMVTSSSEPGQPPVIGGASLAETVGAGLDRLRDGKRQAELSFRITHRSWVGVTVIDLGVLRMRFSGGEREARTVYSRFLSTLTKRDDGLWVFVSDAPSPATETDWRNANQFPHAKYDR